MLSFFRNSLTSIYLTSTTKRYLLLRRQYLRNLAAQVMLGIPDTDAIAYATQVTGFSPNELYDLHEYDFVELYTKFREGWPIPESYEVAARLSSFKGPILKSTTPDEILGYATGINDGDANRQWRDLYARNETARIECLLTIIAFYKDCHNLDNSLVHAAGETGVYYTKSQNLIYQVCDFNIVYSGLVSSFYEHERAIVIGYELTGLSSWHDLGLPAHVRKDGKRVIDEYERWGKPLTLTRIHTSE